MAQGTARPPPQWIMSGEEAGRGWGESRLTRGEVVQGWGRGGGVSGEDTRRLRAGQSGPSLQARLCLREAVRGLALGFLEPLREGEVGGRSLGCERAERWAGAWAAKTPGKGLGSGP